MRIISWNCQMAFRNKFEQIVQLKPDLLIVIECENRAKLVESLESDSYKEIIWAGQNPHKGIAIIRFSDFTLKPVPTNLNAYKYILRFELVDKEKIDLWVIWAMPHNSNPAKSYVSQIWRALQRYKSTMGEKAILIGDFNSNAIWDKKNRVGNHSDVVRFLEKRSILSLYHHSRQEEHGAEKEPTWYLHKKEEKPYHLDYCFLSESLIDEQTEMTVGKFKDWIAYSDHVPVMIDLPFF